MHLNEDLWTSTDEELARLGQAGDERALALLYHRFKTRVYRFVQHRGADDILAEEVTSQTLEYMIRTLNRFQGRSTLATWVMGIACRRLRRARTKSDPEPVPLEECYAIPGSAVLEPAEITRREDRSRLCRSLLDRLTAQQRETVQLVALEGMSWAEVARLQGRSPGAVGLTLNRAMHRFRSLWQENEMKSTTEPQSHRESES
jgi:RNA polymerase sigma-70 factor (ECF subfamily)